MGSKYAPPALSALDVAFQHCARDAEVNPIASRLAYAGLATAAMLDDAERVALLQLVDEPLPTPLPKLRLQYNEKTHTCKIRVVRTKSRISAAGAGVYLGTAVPDASLPRHLVCRRLNCLRDFVCHAVRTA
jgi:hypothetical protein